MLNRKLAEARPPHPEMRAKRVAKSEGEYVQFTEE